MFPAIKPGIFGTCSRVFAFHRIAITKSTKSISMKPSMNFQSPNNRSFMTNIGQGVYINKILPLMSSGILKWHHILKSSVNMPQRTYAGDAPTSANAVGGKQGEIKVRSVLGKAFPKAKDILVEDISGGCGSMYQVRVESSEFEGLSIVKQHQLVNKALQEEIKGMHGIRIETAVSKQES